MMYINYVHKLEVCYDNWRNSGGGIHFKPLTQGFTLAEVLITLAVIGIVAAMTIPTLMHKYQTKVLKTQFMNKYALLAQQMLYAKNDFGGNFQNYCAVLIQGAGYVNAPKCIEMFDNYFKVTGTCNYKSATLNYAKNKNGYLDSGATHVPDKLLLDGSCYGIKINAGRLGFTFDVNGADKGPNALGHDIFSFWVDKNDYLQPIKMTARYTQEELDERMSACEVPNINSSCGASVEQLGYPCTKNSSQKGNGLGCSWYAVNDVCPDDETKSYWECLPK